MTAAVLRATLPCGVVPLAALLLASCGDATAPVDGSARAEARLLRDGPGAPADATPHDLRRGDLRRGSETAPTSCIATPCTSGAFCCARTGDPLPRCYPGAAGCLCDPLAANPCGADHRCCPQPDGEHHCTAGTASCP